MPEVVRRVVALQAQSSPAPYLALWNRIADLDLADVDRAFTDRSLIKTSLMRITLHAVDTTDYPAFHAASTPLLRAARLNDRRFRDTGLTVDDADGAVAPLLELLETPRSKAEILEHLAENVSSEPRLWWALKTYAPLVHSPTGESWSFDGDTRYERAATLDRPPRDDAIRFADPSLPRRVWPGDDRRLCPVQPAAHVEGTAGVRGDARRACHLFDDRRRRAVRPSRYPNAPRPRHPGAAAVAGDVGTARCSPTATEAE